MATLISGADGNLTGTSTFVATDTGAGSANLIKNYSSTTLGAASTITTVAFTVANGSVIDGVLLFVKQGGAGSTGTFKVDLQKGGVSQSSCTVNKTDLPDYFSSNTFSTPTLFKLGANITGDGGANWTLVLTTTGAVAVAYSYVSTNNTPTRALRTTTFVTAAAGDDIYIVGEMRSPGAHTSYTVTMDSTGPTAYGSGLVWASASVPAGGIHIGGYGTLTYGTNPSTNYLLRVKGDIHVYQFGVLNIGSPGAEIPRSSTAVLEFQPTSADGDFGLNCRDYSVVNIAGLSRTVGKNIVKCKLTADVTSASLITTGQNAGGTTSAVGLDASGTSRNAASQVDSTANSTHGTYWYNGSTYINQTQTGMVWLAPGNGLNNRYARLTMGNNSGLTAVTNGFYVDVDLQTGTLGTATAIGNGTAIGATIAPVGAGYFITVTGKVSTASATTYFHVVACSGLGVTVYTGNATQCFLYQSISFINGTPPGDTVFNIDTNTGWLAGDAVCVASTSQSGNDCALFPLNANAGASSFTSALYPYSGSNNPVRSHRGTAPMQAEVGLLNRNIKIRSTSVSFYAYVYCQPMATFTATWAQFYYLGASSQNRRGIEIDPGTTANPKSITYCSIIDHGNMGVMASTSGTSLNLTFSNNVLWGGSGNGHVWLSSTISNHDWTIDNNLSMKNGSYGYYLGDLGGVCTNNICAGHTTSYGFYLTATSNSVLGTFDNNVAHSGIAPLQIATTGINGIISNFTAYRCGTLGIVVNSSGSSDLVVSNLLSFGHGGGANLSVDSPNYFTLKDAVLCGDTTYPTQYGIQCQSTGLTGLNLINVDMSGTGGGGLFVPHSVSDFNFNGTENNVTGLASNCLVGAPGLFNGSRTNWADRAYLAFQKYNRIAGDHRVEMTYGQLKTDITIYKTASPSMRMTPISALGKLESAPRGQGMTVAVANGGTCLVSVNVRKSAVSDVFPYNGNPPRLIQRANAALGRTTDRVLATGAAGGLTTTPALWETSTATAATISGGGLVATSTGTTSADQGVRAATTAAQTAGKFYFEITLTTLRSGANVGLGIGTPASTYTALGTSASTGVQVYPGSGNIWASGSYTNITLGARATGNVIGVAVDLDNRKIWFRAAPSGNWNALAGNDPGTPSTGINIPAGATCPFCTFGGGSGIAGTVFTANFGASAFTGAVPSGFTSGWLIPVQSGLGVWETLSGVSSIAAADDGAWEFVVDCDGTSGWINVDDWGAS